MFSMKIDNYDLNSVDFYIFEIKVIMLIRFIKDSFCSVNISSL